MSNFQFIFPGAQIPFWLGAGLGLLALGYWALRRLERIHHLRLDRFVSAGLATRLILGYDARVRRPLFWLTLAGLALLLLTFAQPHWGQAWVDIERGSRDILIVLDTSESMNAANPLPTRLERAKQKIESLVAMNPADRFGLVAFSGEASLQCPLTLDHGYFKSVLNAVDTDMVSEEGTDIADALRTALDVFEEDIELTGEENRHGRAIMLISDGEQVSGDAVSVAAEVGREAGLYVMGLGDPDGAEVSYPEWKQGRARVSADSMPSPIHISKLDEDTLSRIAVEGGGVYVRSRPANEDVETIHKELELLTTRAVSGELRFSLVNRYRWPLCAAFLAFAAEGLWIVLMPHIRAWRLSRGTAAGGVTAHG
ncbi:MAG: VWA domain-containing protein [Candidatus Hydrogenedentes bacterium]|nr:VWA domain-containing protein [Candidatus Hydrogenedentota bacterium]